MPSVQGSRIVMINVAVNDLERSRRFYEELLNVQFAEERHGDGPLHLNTTFGEWNTPSWFLLALWPDSDRAGTVDIGFLVDDLDQPTSARLRPAQQTSTVHARFEECREPRSSKTQAGTTSASTKPDQRRRPIRRRARRGKFADAAQATVPPPQRWTRSLWERCRRTPQVAFLTARHLSVRKFAAALSREPCRGKMRPCGRGDAGNAARGPCALA